MKNNSFLTSLSKDLVRDVRDLMAGNSSVEAPLEELGEAAKTLTAKQKKIDKNHNGKLDADDFRRLRAEGIDRVVIHSPYAPDIHGGLAEVTHRDLRTGVVTVMFENMYYKLKKGQFKELPEEFEQLDELSKNTLTSYKNKAAREHDDLLNKINPRTQRAKRNSGYSDEELDRKLTNRGDGYSRAVKKLAKEEVEELDELSKSTLGSYVKKAAGSAAYNAMQHGKKKAEQDEVDRITNRHMSFGDKDKIHAALKTTHRDVEEPREKAGKRIAGINMAVKKLTKEEVEELDELSKGTLASYAKKAGGTGLNSAGAHGMDYGVKIANKDFSKKSREASIKKAINRAKGVERAVDRLTKEDVEELDELSSATLSSYTDKAKPQSFASGGKDIKKRFNRIDGDVLARAKQSGQAKVNANEDVELSQDEIDMIEASLADLEEGRGRPPKEGSEAWKRRQSQAADDIPALGIQLRKAASINKPVTFANGETKQIHANHINRFNDHMDARKTSQEKADFQKTANKSHADFVKAVTADVPHRGKDTGEIVKYGK